MSTFSLYSRNESPVKGTQSYRTAVQVSESFDSGLITPLCATNGEIDANIDRLIESLNSVRLAAKRKLAQNNKKPPICK